MLRRIDLPFRSILDEWVSKAAESYPQHPIPPTMLGWISMAALCESTATTLGNSSRPFVVGTDDQVAQAPLEWFTDTDDACLVLVAPPLFGTREQRPGIALVWVGLNLPESLEGHFKHIMSNFGKCNPILFLHLSLQLKPALDASGAQVTQFPGIGQLWEPTLDSYAQEPSIPDDVILDTAMPNDVDDMMSLSSLGMPRPFYEIHVHQHPFNALNCVLRSKSTGKAMSFAFTYKDFSIALVGTKEEFRGRGLARIAIIHVLKKQATFGQSRPFAIIESKNKSSQRTFSKAGFKCTASDLVVCVADGNALQAQ